MYILSFRPQNDTHKFSTREIAIDTVNDADGRTWETSDNTFQYEKKPFSSL